MGRVQLSVAKSFGGTQDTADLKQQVNTLQTQLSAEAQSYRTIIAAMATTCRSLQERIRTLEAERHDTVARGRQSRTRSSSPTVQPGVCHECRSPEIPQQAQDPPNSRDRSQVIFDDAALLQKAWLWF